MGLYRRKEDGSQNWWVSYTVGGRRVRESTKTSNKKDAERFLAERLVGNTVPVELFCLLFINSHAFFPEDQFHLWP